MDVLAQAMNVAEQAEAANGPVTLEFDLRNPSHRAAYAAALAVLRISGIDEDALIAAPGALPPPPALSVPSSGAAAATQAAREPQGAAANDNWGVVATNAVEESQNAELRRRYVEAMTDMTPDEDRRRQVARDTFSRVVELLRDGANVDSVAQIQYRRWVEDHLDAVR
jgi:hypothetical protein